MNDRRNWVPYVLLILILVIIDQVVKLVVFYNMSPGSGGEIKIIGDFFKLHFVQNPGMAFGIQLEATYGKLILSLLRISITIGLIYYLFKEINQGASRFFLISLSLIVAGAIGNGVDTTFYGVLLDNAPPNSPTPWLYGQVVDMFYMDIWKGRVSDSIPLIGGRHLFLWPIFNIADASVSIGVVTILLFQGRMFKSQTKGGEPLVENENGELGKDN